MSVEHLLRNEQLKNEESITIPDLDLGPSHPGDVLMIKGDKAEWGQLNPITAGPGIDS